MTSNENLLFSHITTLDVNVKLFNIDSLYLLSSIYNHNEILIFLNNLPGFATIHQVECIDLVHTQTWEAMVIDMMMIVMQAGRKIEMAMVMEEKEKWALEMMIGPVVMEIVMVEIMRTVMAEKVTEMMTGEEVGVLTTNMIQEAGALIESVISMMMANTHLGKAYIIIDKLFF
jgi:hypothetical protein